ncbi:MAG: anthranilate synthase component I [Paracoccaceae bacterium]
MINEISPSFKKFKETGNYNQLIFKKIIADKETPVSIFEKACAGQKNCFLLESVTGGENKARYSIIGMKPDLIWESIGGKCKILENLKESSESKFRELKNNPLAELNETIDRSKIDIPLGLPPMIAGLFGYVSYDVIRLIESLPHINSDELDVPDIRLIRPTVLIVLDSIKNELIVASPAWSNHEQSLRNTYDNSVRLIEETVLQVAQPRKKGKAGGLAKSYLGKPVSNFTKKAYLNVVNKAKNYIKSGDIFQVVPSQRWKMKYLLPGFSLYRSLRRTNPSPYMFYFEFSDFSIIGSSPEILVKVENDDEVTIRPIAGTRPRGFNESDDKALENDLLNDKKELAEHLMLLDLGRNDIGKVSKIGSVKITESFVIERYSHVMHIVSNIKGKLSEGVNNVSALLSGLPAGTVSGAPKIRAMEIIDELENEKRSIFGGGVGYFGASGQMDFCIAIRTAVLKDNNLYLQAGGGVVFDSDAETEFQETVNKSKALLKAAEDSIHFFGD